MSARVDGFLRMPQMLIADVVPGGTEGAQPDGFDGVSSGPTERMVARRVTFAVGDHRASPFQSLKELGNVRRWMEPYDHGHMSTNYAEFEYGTPFLLSHRRQELSQERRPCRLSTVPALESSR